MWRVVKVAAETDHEEALKARLVAQTLVAVVAVAPIENILHQD
jgi:hypothetical protein